MRKLRVRKERRLIPAPGSRKRILGRASVEARPARPLEALHAPRQRGQELGRVERVLALLAGERSTLHGGRWAYKISGYAPFSAGLAQVVPVLPGRAYRVTTYYQLYPPGDGQAFLAVQDGTSPAPWVGDSWLGVWRPLSQVVTPTSGWLTISLHGSNGPDPNTNVYFDDVTVVAVGSP